MSESFTAQEFAELEQFVSSGDRDGYYRLLSSKGYEYTDLALGVVNQDSWAGIAARIYADRVAEDAGVGLSDALWVQVSEDLMEADFAARRQFRAVRQYDRV